MRKQTIIFLALLFSAVIIAVVLPGILLQIQENRIVDTMQYAPSERYSFRTDEQGLSLTDRLIAAADPDNSVVSLELDAVANVYGSRETVLQQFNEELQNYLAALLPDLPDADRPVLPDDTYLFYKYVLERNTMQGFLYCFAECSVAGGELYMIMDMESRRIVQAKFYNSDAIPEVYDYFSLRMSEYLADYYGMELVASDLNTDALNMLLGGGGQAGSIRLQDDKGTEFSFAFSCWQYGLLINPKYEERFLTGW